MVANIDRMSTHVNNVTLPYVLSLADKGWQRALAEDPHFADGAIPIACSARAEAYGYRHSDLE